MNSRLVIPEKIKVGFVKRSDTYSGKLGYVIYQDNKKVWRKEKSWEGWRDNKIDTEFYDNVPTDGFVLNRDVGGVRQSYGWDARIEKVRVYDSRGFEFEITIPNLLFILQECTSVKGKGLEGSFVYGWDGPSLVLVPTSSAEYKKSCEHTVLISKKVTSKELQKGCLYMFKDHTKRMYLGKHSWWRNYKPSWGSCRGEYGDDENGKKVHIFKNLDAKVPTRGESCIYDKFKDTNKVSEQVSEVLPEYAEEYTALMDSGFVVEPSKLVTKPMLKVEKDGYSGNSCCCVIDGKFYVGGIQRQYSGYWNNSNYRFNICLADELVIEKGELKTKRVDPKIRFENLTSSEVLNRASELWVEFVDGKRKATKVRG